MKANQKRQVYSKCKTSRKTLKIVASEHTASKRKSFGNLKTVLEIILSPLNRNKMLIY